MQEEERHRHELEQIREDVRELRRSTEVTQQTVQTALAVSHFHTEVITQLLRQLEIIVCLLENISKQTCYTLNEAHYQTELQKVSQNALSTLVELYRTEHPKSALELERIHELNKRVEACCPPEEPKPICEPQPCVPEPTPPEGSAGISETSVEPNQVSGAPFPPFEIEGEPLTSRNEDLVPPAPIGPFRGTLAPTFQGVIPLQLKAKIDEAAGAGAAGDPVIFAVDTPFGNQVSFSGIPPDMSGAMRDNVVFMTGNTFAALSTDGGNTFTSLNPTAIFPSGPTRDAAGNLLDNGLCCDQVVQYAPQIDRFIWLMQFCGSGASCLQGVNKLRIASASPADIVNSGGTAWTYWDLTSATFNLGNRTMDYPDMSIGTNYLYVSADKVLPPNAGGGLLVMRIPLSQIQSGITINIGYTNPADSGTAYGGHLSQNTGDTVFWAGHNNTSQMRVFSLPENSNQYSWRSININSWPNSDYSSTCPDTGKTDWLKFLSGFPSSAVIGATRRFGGGAFGGPASEVWFAWTAARGGGFPHPHIQIVQIDTSNWSVTKQWQIWNPNFAFAYPCLATNANQEIGISLGWGGNTFFANHAVGILGDFVVWYSELSDAAISRWGDFVTARQASPRTTLYAATGYSVLKKTPPATGTRFNPRYVLFGRASEVNPIPIG
jgi:hypothetical protein